MTQPNTKTKILMAARTLFVEQGFSGTSMGAIAKQAGVNHSLLFHHFGNKEQLWVAVKQSIAKDADEQSTILPATTLPYRTFLQDLMQNSMTFYREHPDLVRMMNWQRLERDNAVAIGVTLSTGMQTWINAFKHYQIQGDINKHHKVEFVITVLLGIISSAALDPNQFIEQDADLQSYITFCLDSLTRAWK